MTHLRNEKILTADFRILSVIAPLDSHRGEHMSVFYRTYFADELDNSLSLNKNVVIVGQRKASLINH